MYNLGDYVQSISTDKSLGYRGIVVEVHPPIFPAHFGIKFPHPFPGHNCNGLLPDNTGWYLEEHEMVLIHRAAVQTSIPGTPTPPAISVGDRVIGRRVTQGGVLSLRGRVGTVKATFPIAGTVLVLFDDDGQEYEVHVKHLEVLYEKQPRPKSSFKLATSGADSYGHATTHNSEDTEEVMAAFKRMFR